MSYVSPLHILKELAGDEPFVADRQSLLRLRKRLLAELELSGETALTIKGRSYSKDGIIRTIDQLMDSGQLALHDFIYRHPPLLNYLEQEQATPDNDPLLELIIREDIREALDKLLADRIILQFKRGIGARKFDMSRQALALTQLLNSNFRIACYEEAHRSLMAFLGFLQELKKRINSHSGEEIRFLGLEPLPAFMNSLPHDFLELKRSLINAMINIVVLYDDFSEHDHQIVISISSALIQMACEGEQATLIRNNHAFFTSGQYRTPDNQFGYTVQSTKQPAKKNANLDFRAFLYLIVAIIVVAIFLGNSGESDEQVVPEPGGYKTASAPAMPSGSAPTLDAFRKQVLAYTESLQSADRKLLFMGDSVMTYHGLSPFADPGFYTSDSTGALWTWPLDVRNQTDFDLVLFRFDSAGTKLFSTYIQKGKLCRLYIGRSTRLAFYFGNSMRILHTVADDRLKDQELFAENHPNTTELFKLNYRISVQKASDTSSLAILDLPPSFLAHPKSAVAFANFRLSEVTEEAPLGSADIMPMFPGGMDKIGTFIKDHISYPQRAADQQISGQVVVRFVIGTDGKVAQARVLRGIPACPECDAEALRVIRRMPEWTPGMNQGKRVSVYFDIPIRFQAY